MKAHWKIAVSIVCAALICGAATAWHLSKTRAHERKLAGDAKACAIRAGQGDAKSEYELGSRYYYGRGVPQSYEEALEWYGKAADQGYTKAERGLGYMYYYGKGVDRDFAAALGWYRKAADQGDAAAEADVGDTYYHGNGATLDYAEAVRWYRLAANQNLARAEDDLGDMYFYGLGVTQDRAEAKRWFHKAAEQGDVYAQHRLGLRTGQEGSFLRTCDLVIALWSLVLLVSGLPRGGRVRVQRAPVITGLLGLACVVLYVYAHSSFGVFRYPIEYDAYLCFKDFLVGTFVVMAVSIVTPRYSWPKIAKVGLGIIGVVFVAFNVFAVVHASWRQLVPAIQLFCMANAMLVGMSVPTAVFLWRERQNPEAESNSEHGSAAHP
jgi:hypothetical protein